MIAGERPAINGGSVGRERNNASARLRSSVCTPVGRALTRPKERVMDPQQFGDSYDFVKSVPRQLFLPVLLPHSEMLPRL